MQRAERLRTVEQRPGLDAAALMGAQAVEGVDLALDPAEQDLRPARHGVPDIDLAGLSLHEGVGAGNQDPLGPEPAEQLAKHGADGSRW